MAQLQSTNVAGTLCVNGVAIGGGKDFKFCCFTTSTTFTPSSNLVDGDGAMDTILVGGGGGGGGALMAGKGGDPCGYTSCGKSGGNGGGGMVYAPFVPITSTAACTVTVGAGGTGGIVYFDPALTDVGNGSSDIVDLATNGGDSSFAGNTVLGGGGGFNCGVGWCNWRQQYQVFYNCSVRSIGGERNSSGGSSYMGQDDPSLQASGVVVFNYLTGSAGNVYNFTNCGRGITLDNGVTFGAGGGNALVGGNPAYQTSSVTVADPDAVFGVYGGRDEGNAINVAVTASSYEPRFKGAGGIGSSVTVRSGCGSYYCANSRGASGVDGIVILKWNE